MEKSDWAKVIIIFALLYLLSRLAGFIGVLNGFLWGDIILMIVILILAWCSSGTSRVGMRPSFEQRTVAKRDKKIASKEKLDWVKTQYYEKNKTIQDIAEELGESMVSVRKCLDEIDEIEKTQD